MTGDGCGFGLSAAGLLGRVGPGFPPKPSPGVQRRGDDTAGAAHTAGDSGHLPNLAVPRFPFLLYNGVKNGLHSQGCEDDRD